MSTKFYLSNNAASFSPDFSSYWQHTSQADRKACSTGKAGSSLTEKMIDFNTSGTQKTLVRQYVSNPIAAQNLSGTVYGQLQGREDDKAFNCFGAVMIKVTDISGTYVRDLYSGVSTTEYHYGNPTNRFAPVSGNINTVNLPTGKSYYLVVEYGISVASLTAISGAGNTFGDSAGTDLPIDQTNTSPFNPWLTFDKNIVF